MATATISSKYQVVIPKEIRSEMEIQKGQVVQILVKGGVISLIPDRSLSGLRGFLSGMSTTGSRDKTGRV